MLKRLLHIVLVSALTVLLLFGATAKEFVHLFAHHEDTLHHTEHVCPPGEAHFEAEHHHCSFLGFVLEPFQNDLSLPFVARTGFRYAAPAHASMRECLVYRSVCHILLRGPPAGSI